MNGKIENCRKIVLPKIEDNRGNLTFIQKNRDIPFEISRVYYLYDIPGGAERGSHAHKSLHQLIIPIAGSFDITIDDGSKKTTFKLDRSNTGLYLCPMIWRGLNNFTTGSVCLVLASNVYDKDDYIRDYDDFLQLAKELNRKV